MCDVIEECDGRMVQGKCTECGAFPGEGETARFSGGAGSRRHALCDEDYKRQMEKLANGGRQ